VEQSTRFIGMDVHKATIAVAATGEVGKATGLWRSPQYHRSAAEAGGAPAPGRQRANEVLLRSRPEATASTTPRPGLGRIAWSSSPR
jgi:hypothetical protein